MSNRKQSRRLDWANFTDFRSRNTKEDLIRLCNGLKREELEEIFSTVDKTGLYPIHWAAIHNRFDMIDFMVDNGSQIFLKCKNKLFAQGTALHLAAMNGSIEAASMLLDKCDLLDENQTSFKTLNLTPVTTKDPQIETAAKSASEDKVTLGSDNIGTQDKESMASRLLRERDLEGQTALMRSAAPKSKRLSIVRDLLRKNFWSLNGRPGEMALLLIIKGADWRETDTLIGMNLMHLSIINGYDDIVSLLLVLDKSLIGVPAKLRRTTAPFTETKSDVSNSDLESIDLSRTTTSPSISPISSLASSISTQTDSSYVKPLINTKEKLDDLFSAGLTPLQLAILYGQVAIIGLLWHATKASSRLYSESTPEANKQRNNQTQVTDRLEYSSNELKTIILKALFSNRSELFKFLRGALLKIALILDISVLVIIWMPIYFSSKSHSDHTEKIVSNLAGGIFLVSFCTTLLLAFRVIFKNPGYLKQVTTGYFNELNSLIRLRPRHLTTLPVVSESPVVYSATDERRLRLDLKDRIKLLCHKCKCIRRPRSWHCNHCNYCVQDFDHHCIYLGCCIGRYNRLDFLLMMIALAITSIYGTIIQASSIDRNQWKDFSHLMGFVWIFKYALIGGLSAFFILRRACLGVTMFEMIRSNRIRKVFGSKGLTADISKLFSIDATSQDLFWRYSPDRYMTGDLPLRKILNNLKEFANQTSASDYFLSIVCTDSSLKRSLMSSTHPLDTKIMME